MTLGWWVVGSEAKKLAQEPKWSTIAEVEAGWTNSDDEYVDPLKYFCQQDQNGNRRVLGYGKNWTYHAYYTTVILPWCNGLYDWSSERNAFVLHGGDRLANDVGYSYSAAKKPAKKKPVPKTKSEGNVIKVAFPKKDR